MIQFKSVQPVERVRNLSPRDFNLRFAAAHRPVLIEGVASQWPACQRWSLPDFRERLGDHRVPVEVWEGEDTAPGLYLERVRQEEMTIRDYVDRCTAGGPSKRYYLAQYPIFDKLPALRGEVPSLEEWFDFPAFYPAALRRLLTATPLLWMGPGGTVSNLHFDVYQNLFVQICGRKRFTLVSPEQSTRLGYPEPSFGLLANFSPLDLERPDPRTLALSREVDALDCEVGPGEVLFIPLGWWHHVRSLEASISMNFWWWPVLRTLVYSRRHIAVSLRTVISRKLRGLPLSPMRQ
jgi:[protein]-arginine 3-hydroxylase / protease